MEKMQNAARTTRIGMNVSVVDGCVAADDGDAMKLLSRTLNKDWNTIIGARTSQVRAVTRICSSSRSRTPLLYLIFRKKNNFCT